MKLLFFSFAPVKSFPLPRSSRKRGKETFFLPLLFRSPPLLVVLRVSLPTPLPSAGESYKPFRFPTFLQSQKGGKKKNPFFSLSLLSTAATKVTVEVGCRKKRFFSYPEEAAAENSVEEGFWNQDTLGRTPMEGGAGGGPPSPPSTFLSSFFPAKLLRETVIGRRKAPPGEEGRGE